jgi:dolichyl-phosphate beta-glucosyltransferase
MELSVIIPAHNEERRLPATLDRVLPYLAGLGSDWEVIVVNNNSSDGTVALVEIRAQTEPRLKLLHEPRPGKGIAVRTGMLAAEGEVVLFSDADLSCPIEEQAKLRRVLTEGYDVAIASRRLPQSQVEKSLKREMMSALFNWVIQLLALPGIKDSQCGFKAFLRVVAHDLFNRSQVDGWAFDVEILFLARKLKYRIAEVPVSWHEVGGSHINPVRDSLRMVRDIIKFRWRMLMRKY